MTENKTCGHGFANGMTYLLVGGGIGAVLALLFAPKSGNALRGDIADLSRKGYDATLEKANHLKTQSSEVIDTVKGKAEAVYDFAAAKLAASSDTVSNAADAASDAVADGLGQVHNAGASKHAASGRKSSSIV